MSGVEPTEKKKKMTFLAHSKTNYALYKRALVFFFKVW